MPEPLMQTESWLQSLSGGHCQAVALVNRSPFGNMAKDMAVLPTVGKCLHPHDRPVHALDQMVNEMRLRFAPGLLAAATK